MSAAAGRPSRTRPARRAFTLALLIWFAVLARDGFDAFIDATELPPLVPETSVEILARDGTLLRAFTVEDGRWRLAVAPEEVDRDYLAMLIAYEDRRFHSHSGIDVLALGRAVWQALTRGRVVSGGSTLTMQVARLIEDGPTGRLAGKLRQLRVALALERRLTKGQILALYMHHAPFGGNLEGIRAASFAYLGREPHRLTPAEAALMVAIPQSPEARRPDRNPEAAEAARARVLARMRRDGVIAPDRARAAMTESVPRTRRPFPMLAAQLADRLVAEAPERRLHRTTIDARLQARLEDLARGAVAGGDPALSAAIMVADHATGEILASVGGPDYGNDARRGYVDMTRALRSPGSTLKPLIYGLAFDDGLAHPATLIEDRPADFGRYAPRNFDGRFRGDVTVREALELSLNLPVVAVTEALGPARLIAALERAGVRAVVPGEAPGLAVALGGVGVPLEGLVHLYAALARGGAAVRLRVRARESGAPADGEAPAARLMGPGAAWHLGDILSGAAPPPGAPALRIAWKTGTSYGHRDALALGYDGRVVAGVWLGRPDGTPVPGAFGAEVAAPVLFETFQRLGAPVTPLPPAPADALLADTAELPAPLRRFRGRDGSAGPQPDAPRLAFPPDGAAVEALEGAVHARVTRGTPPFTWLADGAPVALASRGRAVELALPGPGFVTLSVIDAEGRAARAQIELLP